VQGSQYGLVFERLTPSVIIPESAPTTGVVIAPSPLAYRAATHSLLWGPHAALFLHLFGQGAAGHPLPLEGQDHLEEMGERAAEAVQCPDAEAVARWDKGEGLPEPGAVV
jgi:hypothetical protein